MTVFELRKRLSEFPDDEPVWVYDPNDENEMYKEIESVERGLAGDLTIYSK